MAGSRCSAPPGFACKLRLAEAWTPCTKLSSPPCCAGGTCDMRGSLLSPRGNPLDLPGRGRGLRGPQRGFKAQKWAVSAELAVAGASPGVSGRLQWGSFWVWAWDEPLCCRHVRGFTGTWQGLGDVWGCAREGSGLGESPPATGSLTIRAKGKDRRGLSTGVCGGGHPPTHGGGKARWGPGKGKHQACACERHRAG